MSVPIIQKAHHKHQAGFTLIELMVVVAILGNLFALAMPAMKQYIARSQVTGALHLTGDATKTIFEYYGVQGEFPESLSDTFSKALNWNTWENVSDVGKYVDYVSGFTQQQWNPETESYESSDTYVIYAYLKRTGVSPYIQGTYVIQWTNDGGKSWSCGPLWESQVVYFPSYCRTPYYS
ncbi:pilin [Magnetococcales bacterium HHB-1]